MEYGVVGETFQRLVRVERGYWNRTITGSELEDEYGKLNMKWIGHMIFLD